VSEYSGLYPYLEFRRGVWEEIARYVERDAPHAETVVELGAGYCDFINQFPARTKIAFDLNPQMVGFAGSDVDLRIQDATELPGVEDETVDLVFASNFFEHLTAREIEALLPNVRRVLRRGGRLALIQPNYRLCSDRYFVDPTHKTIFTDQSLATWLEAHGLHVLRVVPGLLPFSMRSRVPKWPILTRAYLWSPWRPFAAQMYVVAERS
jgi:SAM-dependent methyltransferase